MTALDPTGNACMLLAAFSAHCWFTVNISPSRSPGFFSAKLFSRLQCVLVHRVKPHLLEDLAFPFVEFYEVQEQELAHFLMHVSTCIWFQPLLSTLYCPETCCGCTLTAPPSTGPDVNPHGTLLVTDLQLDFVPSGSFSFESTSLFTYLVYTLSVCLYGCYRTQH